MVGADQVGRIEGGVTRGDDKEEFAMNPALPAITLLVAFAAGMSAAPAQDYPTRPITLIVPYAAGGGNDVMARTVADKMSRTLG